MSAFLADATVVVRSLYSRGSERTTQRLDRDPCNDFLPLSATPSVPTPPSRVSAPKKIAGKRLGGLALSLWAGQAATSMLYDWKPYDPVTLAGAVGVLAYRASRFDPMVALREE